MFGKSACTAIVLCLVAYMGTAHAMAGSSGGSAASDLNLLCLGQDHRFAPSRSMQIGCLVAQPLPDVQGGQRLRSGTMPIWYPGGVSTGTTYSLDLSWAIRAKGNVYFWLKAEYKPARVIGGNNYTARISEAMFDCATGKTLELKGWNYDAAGKASSAKKQQKTVLALPESTVSTLKDQCTVAAQAY